jgi:hypothetical protein
LRFHDFSLRSSGLASPIVSFEAEKTANNRKTVLLHG